jgi:hypothetical protein
LGVVVLPTEVLGGAGDILARDVSLDRGRLGSCAAAPEAGRTWDVLEGGRRFDRLLNLCPEVTLSRTAMGLYSAFEQGLRSRGACRRARGIHECLTSTTSPHEAFGVCIWRGGSPRRGLRRCADPAPVSCGTRSAFQSARRAPAIRPRDPRTIRGTPFGTRVAQSLVMQNLELTHSRLYTFLIAAVLIVSVGQAEGPRAVSPGSTSEQCLTVGADCVSDEQCCSQWCVNRVCETREP